MKKINLDLDYNRIKERIEIDKSQYGVGEWADKVGTSISSVSNIHGKASRINPSLEYIIAVAKLTGKPIEWYLYGKEVESDFTCGWSEEAIQACKDVKEILESDDKLAALAVKTSIAASLESVRRKKENDRQKEKIKTLEKKVRHLEKLLVPGGDVAGETAGGSAGRKKAM